MGLKMMKIAAALIGVMGAVLGAESTPNTFITEWRCNANYYSKNDAYAGNVEYVLADLVRETPNAGNVFFTQSPSKTDICYGYAICGSSLSSTDCAYCLSPARDAVKDICADKIGGMVEMVDCTIRYENYPI